MSEDRSIMALRDLGTAIWFPDVPEVALDLAAAHRPHPLRRPRALGPAIAGLAALVIVVTPVGHAIADWLGIGAVRIVEVADSPQGGDDIVAGLGIEVDGDRSELLGALARWPEALGSPDRVFVFDPVSGVRAISAVWLPGEGLPEVGDSGVGALLTRYVGTISQPIVEKSVGEDATVTIVTVSGTAGYWIEGDPHMFAYLDSDGNTVEESIRLAGNTLLWEVDGVSFRFESALDRDAAVDVADSID